MGNLEKILSNLGKGFASGVTSTLDPVGEICSNYDRALSGKGYSDKQAVNTVYNKIHRSIYKKPSEKLSFGKDYVPRALGKLAGIGTGLVGYVLAPIALTIPILTGGYSLIRSIAKYIKGTSKKESSENNFYKGLKFGWSKGSNLFYTTFHNIEGNLTGRGYQNSKIGSSVKEQSKSVNRGFGCVLGNIFGSILGIAASVLSLGFIPLYKGLCDSVRIVENTH